MIYEKVIEAMGIPFTLVYMVILLGFVYFFFVSIPKTIKSKSWPIAVGKVVSSELRKVKRTTKNGAVTIYRADIEYLYNVNGKEYYSKKIKLIDHSSDNNSHHQENIEKYPINQTVDVFFNPKKPSVGVLEPGFGTGNFVALIFFILSLGSMTLSLSTKI